MRRLIVSTFVSLDGVMQAPGGPAEDPTGGFTLGGWTFPYWDEQSGAAIARTGLDSRGRDLLLGRKTYEIFAAHWPHQPAGDPVAQSLNGAKKHVATRTLTSLAWNNSSRLAGDAGTAVAALKKTAGSDLQVIGSGALIQTLLKAALVDEFNLLVFPVVLGRGKRLFETGVPSQALRLIRSESFATGMSLSTYEPAGAVHTGSFVPDNPGAEELARREKMKREG